MKRRELLSALPVLASAPLLVSCSADDSQDGHMFSVEIWIDSNPDSFSESTAVRLASAQMTESSASPGLFSLPAPMSATLPSGLVLQVSCERVASGHFHLGISHDGQLVTSGKYSGPFTVRAFPAGHSSYVLDVKAT
ncbi:hypothetical protein [Pseudomonas sp. SO81]|uniref:hypothetical protein n=1 Tax=Pseudomonas sp. SO81 TaxID=2983246 RepID=UPI0025A41409|nr:hypothetical protein [Pseudomonas sp. SO81]WJN58393.1 hypothetical protein OH686_06575 [Pseudomonas sp. SO81]